MVEHEQADLVKESIKECYEVIVFEVGMQTWLDEFIEKVIKSEVNGITAQQITYESVTAFSEDSLEAGLL